VLACLRRGRQRHQLKKGSVELGSGKGRTSSGHSPQTRSDPGSLSRSSGTASRILVSGFWRSRSRRRARGRSRSRGRARDDVLRDLIGRAASSAIHPRRQGRARRCASAEIGERLQGPWHRGWSFRTRSAVAEPGRSARPAATATVGSEPAATPKPRSAHARAAPRTRVAGVGEKNVHWPHPRPQPITASVSCAALGASVVGA